MTTKNVHKHRVESADTRDRVKTLLLKQFNNDRMQTSLSEAESTPTMYMYVVLKETTYSQLWKKWVICLIVLHMGL